ncbi:MAG TPA: BrnT family toxin [Bryobacteraceae bacterium]|nr:BrnT family toxin [Bryobacteraceae bacterium]
MRPIGFEWDDANLDHIARHEYALEEIEEVFTGEYLVRRSRGERYLAYGQTAAGRYTVVVYERRPKGMIRVATARDMNRAERARFRRR